jgi:hypothetical protein
MFHFDEYHHKEIISLMQTKSIPWWKKIINTLCKNKIAEQFDSYHYIFYVVLCYILYMYTGFLSYKILLKTE